MDNKTREEGKSFLPDIHQVHPKKFDVSIELSNRSTPQEVPKDMLAPPDGAPTPERASERSPRRIMEEPELKKLNADIQKMERMKNLKGSPDDEAVAKVFAGLHESGKRAAPPGEELRDGDSKKLAARVFKDKLQKERAKRDSIQRNRLQRMSEEIGEYVEPQKKWYLIYPNNPLKLAFDLLIAIMLIYSCCAVPIQLAFFSDSINSEHNQFWFISFLVVDIFFYIDIVATFFTVYVDKDLNEVEDMKEIALRYF